MTSVAIAGLSYLSKKKTQKEAAYTNKHHWCRGCPTKGRGEVENRGAKVPKWYLGNRGPKFLRGASRAHAKRGALGGSDGRESNPTA